MKKLEAAKKIADNTIKSHQLFQEIMAPTPVSLSADVLTALVLLEAIEALENICKEQSIPSFEESVGKARSWLNE